MSTQDLGALIERAARHPLLTAAEETELAARIERGDAAARNRMIESNVRLVISLARPYRGRGVPLSDLVQEGMIGLIRAVEKFDHRRGLRFSTYAAWWIRHELLRALADDRTIRIPPTALRQLAAVRDVESALERSGRGAASSEEVARRTGFGGRTIDGLRQAAHVTMSLDAAVGEGETTLVELLAADGDATTELSERLEEAEGREQLRELLRLLPARHRGVLERRFGLDDTVAQSHREIGRALGLGEERSRQIERQALTWLRNLAAQRSWNAA